MKKDIKQKKWEVKSLRVTSFIGPSEKLEKINWWEQITGEPPETQISKPKLGGYQEIGPFSNGKLRLSIQPARIDWHFSAIELQEDQIGQDLSLGLIENVLPEFSGIITKWVELPDCPDIIRLAFGGFLIIPVDSHETGYELLNSFLHDLNIDGENSRDFFYQINRPRKSKVINSLEINRLTKWSVIRYAWQLFSSNDAIVDQTESYLCQLELDINTSEKNQSNLSKEQIIKIFNELIELGLEISDKGDIR
jgi:hypothetical protein